MNSLLNLPSIGAMEDSLKLQLLEFTAMATGVPISKLSINSRLFEDLGLEGDDALEFMDSYFEKFKVDSADFQFGDYFGPEGFDLIGLLINLIFDFLRGNSQSLKPLRISDLINSAQQGMWEKTTP